LQPCTLYELTIVPTVPGRDGLTAAPSEFSTTNGKPQPPEGFSASLAGPGSARLSWNAAPCSTGYLVQVRDETNGEEQSERTDETQIGFDTLEPCSEWSYAVSTLVDEQDSEPTQWASVAVPPDTTAAPVLKVLIPIRLHRSHTLCFSHSPQVLSNERDNVTVRLEPDSSNKLCQPAEFMVRIIE